MKKLLIIHKFKKSKKYNFDFIKRIQNLTRFLELTYFVK